MRRARANAADHLGTPLRQLNRSPGHARSATIGLVLARLAVVRRRRLAAVQISIVLALAGCGRINFGSTDDANGGGWPAGWQYRKALVIDHLRVAGDLVDFPVLVDLGDPDLVRAQPTGADLRFVDATGRPLAHELETFGITPTRLIAWVKVPAVSAAVDTTFYLYYGNPSASDPQRAPAVWTGYASVYHFGELDPLDVHDATGVNDGINTGATAAPGQVLGAASFSGGPNISAGAVGVDGSPGGYNTVSFWMRYNGSLGKAAFAFVDAGKGYDLWMASASCFGFNTENSDGLGTTVGIPAMTGRWVHVAAVFYNGVPDATHNQLWIDGVQQTLTTCFGTPTARTATGSVYWASLHGYELTGLLDEGRVSPGVRAPAWIETEFANQRDPHAFVTAGPEQPAP